MNISLNMFCWIHIPYITIVDWYVCGGWSSYDFVRSSEEGTFEWHEVVREGWDNMENNWRSIHPKVLMSINCLKCKESYLFRPGRTVCKAYCVEILIRSCEAVHSKLSELQTTIRFIHHDIASAHWAVCVKQCMRKISIVWLEHAPYSPGLTPGDFWLFQKLKPVWKPEDFSVPKTLRKTWQCRRWFQKRSSWVFLAGMLLVKVYSC